MNSTRKWGFVIGGLMAAAYGVAWYFQRSPLALRAPSGFSDVLVLLGGPCCLVLFTLLAVPFERAAGASLWLGGAAAAIGLALRSGPFLGPYFLGMVVIVLPQLVEGSLFLHHGRRPPPRHPKPRKPGRA